MLEVDHRELDDPAVADRIRRDDGHDAPELDALEDDVARPAVVLDAQELDELIPDAIVHHVEKWKVSQALLDRGVLVEELFEGQ